jgi:hypothetical protein
MGTLRDGGNTVIAIDSDPAYVFNPGYFQEGQSQGETFYSLTCTVDSNNVLSCISSDPTPRNSIFVDTTFDNNLAFVDSNDVQTYAYTPVTLAFVCSS